MPLQSFLEVMMHTFVISITVTGLMVLALAAPLAGVLRHTANLIPHVVTVSR